MKKKYLILIGILLITSITNAQNGVGINTENPSAKFHLKSDKEYIMKFPDLNIEPSNAERIIVSNDDKGTFKVMQTNVFKNIIFGNLPGTAPDINLTNTDFTPTTITIELPRGRWAVNANILLELSNISHFINDANSAITIEATLNINSTTPPTNYTDYIEDNDEAVDDAEMRDYGYGLYQGILQAPLPKGVLKGSIIINNNRTRRYRLFVRVRQEGTVFTGTKLSTFGRLDIKENQLFAVPLN